MKFENLKLDSVCECSKGLKEDNENLFSRRIQTETIDASCFKSYWEQDKRPKDMGVCEEVCKYKGISVHSATDQRAIHEFYRHQISTTTSLKPKHGRGNHFCIFKLKKGAGVLKHTPSKSTSLHYTFFKADSFSHEQIELSEIRQIF